MYLLDTDVLSLGSPVSGANGERVDAWRAWMRVNRDRTFLSALTLMEVRFGIDKLVARGATAKAALLQRWIVAAETVHAGHFLPVVAEIADRAGAMLWKAVGSGVTPGSEDAIIAATAEFHGFVLISRNLRHMSALGIACRDPLTELP